MNRNRTATKPSRRNRPSFLLLAAALAAGSASACANVDGLDAPAQAEAEVKTGWIPGPGGPMQVTYEEIDGRKVLEGDITLTDVSDVDPRLSRSAIKKTANWPGGSVPYEIDGAITNPARVTDAISEWNTRTPFRLTARNGEADYIRFVSSNRCESPIGRQGGRQDIQVGTGCGTMQNIHEIGHSIGLFHEQSRQDRDSFITIVWSNVKSAKAYNFNKYTASDGEDFGPYDISSIMHYPSTITDSTFVNNTGIATITDINGNAYTSSSVLTALDRAAAWKRADVYMPTRDKWNEKSWALGWPLDGTSPTGDGFGLWVPFQWGRVYGTIVATAEVHGDISVRYGQLGWHLGFLGYPKTDETPTPDGIGRYNHFQYGSIYWSPNSGAHEIYGLIRDKWAQLGWERSTLGYPTTGETGTPDGVGRYNHFEHGSIYWTNATGAWKVDGSIRDKWASMGWETSCLKYPTGDSYAMFTNGGRFLGMRQTFQGGTITEYDGSAPTSSCANRPPIIIIHPRPFPG